MALVSGQVLFGSHVRSFISPTECGVGDRRLIMFVSTRRAKVIVIGQSELHNLRPCMHVHSYSPSWL
ncbi:unnamed protein product [Rhizoctonia solani]|nr:unnamed protein product [Rhizoctonia solani]